MKSIDKYVLVLVASLALLLAGCGGEVRPIMGTTWIWICQAQKTALMQANTALGQAVNALVGEATQDEVAAAKKAVAALQQAIEGATDVATSDLAMYRSALRMPIPP